MFRTYVVHVYNVGHERPGWATFIKGAMRFHTRCSISVAITAVLGRPRCLQNRSTTLAKAIGLAIAAGRSVVAAASETTTAACGAEN